MSWLFCVVKWELHTFNRVSILETQAEPWDNEMWVLWGPMTMISHGFLRSWLLANDIKLVWWKDVNRKKIVPAQYIKAVILASVFSNSWSVMFFVWKGSSPSCSIIYLEIYLSHHFLSDDKYSTGIQHQYNYNLRCTNNLVVLVPKASQLSFLPTLFCWNVSPNVFYTVHYLPYQVAYQQWVLALSREPTQMMF
jgi:hypothetical protein